MISKKVSAVLFSVGFLWLSCIQMSYASAMENGADKIVAVVNNDVITQGELDHKIAAFKAQLTHANMAIPSETDLRKQILDNMIYTSLQLQLAQKDGINVADAEVDEAIANISKNNKMTIAELKKSVEQETGSSYEAFRQEIRNEMMLNRVEQQAFGRDIVVSDQEVDAALKHPPIDNEAPQLWQITDVLVAANAGSVLGQKEKDEAASIITALRQGADVQHAVTAQNENKNIQINDLGWRKLTDMPDLFVSAIKGAKAKDVVGPIIAPNGIHVIIVNAIRGENLGKLTKDQARDLVYRKKMQEHLKSWLKELRAKAYIQIM